MIVSMDADLQDDINAVDEMVDNYHKGYEVVYGVRSKRETDTFFKRFTAEGFYKVMKALGVDIVFNHADYRLMSKRAVERTGGVHGGQPVPARHCAADRLQVDDRDLRARANASRARANIRSRR